MTGRQMAEGARVVCREPHGDLSARLAAAGEKQLKIDRACFGVSYVIALLEAYGLVRVDDDSQRKIGEEEEEAAASAAPARVVFADSFGDFEASWALGALISRLMEDADAA
jgi:hypothetical protein